MLLNEPKLIENVTVDGNEIPVTLVYETKLPDGKTEEDMAREEGLIFQPTQGKVKRGKQVVEIRRAYYGVKLGRDLDHAIELFGKEAVYNEFLNGAKVSVHNILRPRLEKGLLAQLHQIIEGWKPGLKVEGDVATAAMKAITGGKISNENKTIMAVTLARQMNPGLTDAQICRMLNIKEIPTMPTPEAENGEES